MCIFAALWFQFIVKSKSGRRFLLSSVCGTRSKFHGKMNRGAIFLLSLFVARASSTHVNELMWNLIGVNWVETSVRENYEKYVEQRLPIICLRSKRNHFHLEIKGFRGATSSESSSNSNVGKNLNEVGVKNVENKTFKSTKNDSGHQRNKNEEKKRDEVRISFR